MIATSGFKRSSVHIHSAIQRALRQHATHNIDIALEPKEGGKLADKRPKFSFPVRAKARWRTIKPYGTPGPVPPVAEVHNALV